MARARLLKPGFFTNAELAAQPPHARLLFAGLWTLADREGRLKDDPPTIKGAIFPHESVDVEELLRSLSKKGFIVRYRAEARRFIALPTFKAHQTPHIREPASQIPEPQEKPSASTGPASGQHRKSRGRHRSSTADPVTVPVTDPVAVPVTREPLDALVADFSAFGATNGGTVKAIEYAVDDYGIESVQRAVREAAGSGFDESPPWSYVEKILKRWKAQGGQDDQPTRNGTSASQRPAAEHLGEPGPEPPKRIFIDRFTGEPI